MSYVVKHNYLDKLKDKIGGIQKEVAEDLFLSLAAATPVDSGRARASWIIVPAGADIPELAPGEYSFPNVPNLSFMRKGLRVEIANSAPYIAYLNEGHSAQAPSLFIDVTVNSVMSKYA